LGNLPASPEGLNSRATNPAVTMLQTDMRHELGTK